MISAFAVAVIQSIRRRRQVHEHAWWLVSTVFLVMMPALARGLQAGWFAIVGFGPEVSVTSPIAVSTAITLALTAVAAHRFGSLRHPATALVVAVNLLNLLLEPIGRSPWVQATIRAVVRD